MNKYIQSFDWTSWQKLSEGEKKRHQYKGCKTCSNYEAFFIKKVNQAVRRARTVNERTPNDRKPKRAEVRSVADVPKEIQREIIKRAIRQQMQQGLARDLAALYSTDISHRKWNKLRRLQYGHYAPRRQQKLRNLQSYRFNRNVVKHHLEGLGVGMELGKLMTGKWSSLAKLAKLTNKKGLPSSAFNGSQASKF